MRLLSKELLFLVPISIKKTFVKLWSVRAVAYCEKGGRLNDLKIPPRYMVK